MSSQQKIQIIVRKDNNGVYTWATPCTGLLESSSKVYVDGFVQRHSNKYNFVLQEVTVDENLKNEI